VEARKRGGGRRDVDLDADGGVEASVRRQRRAGMGERRGGVAGRRERPFRDRGGVDVDVDARPAGDGAGTEAGRGGEHAGGGRVRGWRARHGAELGERRKAQAVASRTSARRGDEANSEAQEKGEEGSGGGWDGE
jgi:hypothetical protein